ncbi:MAG: hypothetical protein C0609_11005 [Deltaproteobacteria bacterium]|nr:MAG: hypothetical protein C0609_11005 [Deltaproteobacteria bacterium]
MLMPAVILCGPAAEARSAFEADATIRLTYDDNISLSGENGDPEEDLITNIIPHLGLTLARPSMSFSADYYLRYAFYRDNTEFDRSEIKDIQRLEALLELGEYRGLAFTARDAIELVSVDERALVSEDNEVVNKSNRNTLVLNPSYKGSLGKRMEISLDYSYKDITHTADIADDRTESETTLKLTEEMSPALKLYLRGSFRETKAELSDDYKYYQGVLGGNFKSPGGVLVELEGGVGEYDYDGGQSSEISIWRGAFVLPHSQRIKTSLEGSRSLGHSESDGAYEVDEWSLTTALSGKVIGEASIFKKTLDFTDGVRKDERRGVAFSAELDPERPLQAGLSLGYSECSFEPEDEDRDFYNAAIIVGYRMRKFGVSASYRYSFEDSDIPGMDVESNVYFIEVTASL